MPLNWNLADWICLTRRQKGPKGIVHVGNPGDIFDQKLEIFKSHRPVDVAKKPPSFILRLSNYLVLPLVKLLGIGLGFSYEAPGQTVKNSYLAHGDGTSFTGFEEVADLGWKKIQDEW